MVGEYSLLVIQKAEMPRGRVISRYRQTPSHWVHQEMETTRRKEPWQLKRNDRILFKKWVKLPKPSTILSLWKLTYRVKQAAEAKITAKEEIESLPMGKYDPKYRDRCPSQPFKVKVSDQMAITTRIMTKTRSLLIKVDEMKFIDGSCPSLQSWQGFSESGRVKINVNKILQKSSLSWENFSQQFTGSSPRRFSKLSFRRVHHVKMYKRMTQIIVRTKTERDLSLFQIKLDKLTINCYCIDWRQIFVGKSFVEPIIIYRVIFKKRVLVNVRLGKVSHRYVARNHFF